MDPNYGIDYEKVHKEVSEEVTRDFKVDKILKAVIELEKIEVSFEELEEEAKAIAERDNTTLEFVQRFMGSDYAMLKSDILKKKARKFLYDNADLK